VEQVDISPALSTHAFSIKDENELRAMRAASKACVALMTPYFLDEMSNILDAEKKVKHSVLAEKVDRKIDDAKFWKTVELPNKGKVPSDFDPTQLDWILGPAIQSGGKYDLKLSGEPNEENLHAGIIIAAFGLRYKSYCSTIARTYLVDPNKSQESNYKLLHMIHNSIIKDIRDGMMAKDVYNKALGIIKAKKPEMEKHFLKNVGWGVGLETRDTTLILNAKNQRTLKDGMTLIIHTGFQDIENPQPQDKNSKIYALVLTDTIRVTSSEPVVFTAEAPTSADANSFFFKDDEEAQPTPKKEKKDSRVGAVATKNITSTRLRSERSTQVDEENDAKRRLHQRELASKKQKEGLARFAESTNGQNGSEIKTFKKFESYKRDNQFPLKIRNLEIIVDAKNHTVVLPIMGRPVPFHINTIKNASKSDEGEFAFLRVNFLSPGQGVARKDDQPFEDATAHFVRSLTFRSEDGSRYADIATQISNMKRDAVKKEQEKKDMEDVVEQDKLVEIRSKYITRRGQTRHDANFDQTVVRPSWIMSIFDLPWKARGSLARSRSIRTVSDISRPLMHNTGSTFCFPTSSTYSFSRVSTS
jgi:nucleosome binding factor SPN SPT16 subunit